MKKLLKVCLALALAATLVACGGKEATVAKAGLGVISTVSDGQVNTTFAAVALDSEGKIVSVDMDIAQSTPADEAKAYTQTKEELKDAYGMKAISPIGKEWYEQAEAFEAWCVGKTPAEVVAAVQGEDADLAAGCTMHISGFQAVVEKAAANAVEVAAEKVVLGRTMANSADKGALTTTLFMAALDADDKIVACELDVAEISESVLETKAERKDAYGMKTYSPIGKEWYEQADAFEAWCVGKTTAEVVTAAQAGDADLTAGCTMGVNGFLEAVAKVK